MALRLRRVDPIGKSTLSIRAWRHSESPPECPAESLMTLKSARERHIQNRIFASEQHRCGEVQPETQREPLRRFAHNAAKQPVQMEFRNAGLRRKSLQREVFLEMLRGKGDRRLDLAELPLRDHDLNSKWKRLAAS
jgi:hypothetical protein